MTEITGLGDLISRVLGHIENGTYRLGCRESFKRGSANGTVTIGPQKDDPAEFELRVQMSVMRVPKTRETDLFRRLLQLNDQFHGRAAFSLAQDGNVHLNSARPIQDLDPSEVVDLVLWTSALADRFDDVLLTEFGRELAI